MFFCSKFCKVDKLLRSCLYERRGRTKKWEQMTKQRRKPLSFLCELLLEHVTVNETGVFNIPPYKGNRGQYFVYTLSLYKQPVYQQTLLAC